MIAFLTLWVIFGLIGSFWMLYHDYCVDNKLTRHTLLISLLTAFTGPIILLVCFGFWINESKWLDEELQFLKKKEIQKPNQEPDQDIIENPNAPEFKWVKKGST
jgi:hypothetical protein